MVKNILVATPQPAFGELLRLSLEESGRYRVRLVQSGREALASAGHIVFTLAILDSTLDSPPLAYVAQGLRKALPDLHLLVIPPSEGLTSQDLTNLMIEGTVSQPFYAPDLLDTIDYLTVEPKAPGGGSPSQKPIAALIKQPGPALLDPARASRQLEDFLQDSSAPGVLVILSRQPWALAGELCPAAMNEVAGILAHYTESNEGVDLARFVHLSADGNEYLIYATPLTDGLVLALVYQIDTPLTVIRAQAGRLSRLLRQPSASVAPDAPPPQPVVQQKPPAPTPPQSLPEEDDLPDEEEGDGLNAGAQRLAGLLSEMPSPNPPIAPEIINSDWVHAAPIPTPETNEFFFPWEVEAARSTAAQTRDPHPAAPPPQPSPVPYLVEQVETVLNTADELIEVAPVDTATAIPVRRSGLLTPSILVSGPQVLDAQSSSIEQTRPVALRSLQAIQQAEPVMPTVSRLAYTCVLIPRLPDHLLIDQPAEKLAGWLPQLCLAYGWRLENLWIRPEYLQWAVQVAPAISPGKMIRLIRQQSSRRIFSQFPQFEIDNPSGDFWAPGYLIISGFQPPSINLVHDFIRQTRQHQGSASHRVS